MRENELVFSSEGHKKILVGVIGICLLVGMIVHEINATTPRLAWNYDDDSVETRLLVNDNTYGDMENLRVDFNPNEGTLIATGVNFKYNTVGTGPTHNVTVNFHGDGSTVTYPINTIPHVTTDTWMHFTCDGPTFLLDDDPTVEFIGTQPSDNSISLCVDTPSHGHSYYDVGSGWTTDPLYEYLVELQYEPVANLGFMGSVSGNITAADIIDAYFMTLDAGTDYNFILNPQSGSGVLQLRVVANQELTDNIVATWNTSEPEYLEYSPSSSGTYVVLVEAATPGSDTGTYSLYARECHDSIAIDGNADFLNRASSEEWNGIGTESNPIQIVSYSFIKSGIQIQNTTLYFEISHNYFHGGSWAIYLLNVTYGALHYNILEDSGILLLFSNNSIIFGNTLIHRKGTLLEDQGFHNILSNNVFRNAGGSAIISSGYNTTISNNLIDNPEEGIRTYSDNSLIKHNSITNCGIGIRLRAGGHFTTIEHNTITNVNYGVFLGSSIDYCTIRHNTINGYQGSQCGIWLSWGQACHNTISANSITRFDQGVRLAESDSNIISGNSISQSATNGISLSDGENNTISDNIIADNGASGITLSSSTENFLIDNALDNNTQHGIELSASHNNSVSTNTIANSGEYGIFLNSFAVNNTLINNTLTNNEEFGFFLDSSVNHTLVAGNRLLNNYPSGSSQAYDAGFNNIVKGNYWADWLTPDVDNNGFVDDPYPLEGSSNNADPFPLTFSNHTLSPLIILSPNGNDTLQGFITIQWTEVIDYWGHTVTYDIYYSSDNGTTWTLLSGKITTTAYSWNTTTVADGRGYLVKVVATCPGGLTTEDISDGFLAIDNHFLSVLTILLPTGAEILKGVITIQWVVVNDSLNHRLSYSLYYSPNEGASWTLIASALTTTEYFWDTTTVVDGAFYLFKVVAACSEGLTIEDITDRTFTIQNAVSSSPTTSESSSAGLQVILFSLSICYFLSRYRKKREW